MSCKHLQASDKSLVFPLTGTHSTRSNGAAVKSFRLLLRGLVRDDSGATAVEYSLIVGGIATVLIVVLYALGTKVNKLYDKGGNWP